MAEQKKKPDKPERKETAYVVYEEIAFSETINDLGVVDKVLVEVGNAETYRGSQHAITLALEAVGRADDEGAFKAIPTSSAKTHRRTIKTIKEPRWNQEELS